MELKEFVTKTIVDIVDGIDESAAKCSTATICPFDNSGNSQKNIIRFSLNVMVEKGGGGRVNVIEWASAGGEYKQSTSQHVEFEVEVKYRTGIRKQVSNN